MSSTTIHLPNNPITPIQVVTAAIVNQRDKRLFMQRRSGTTRYPWHWGTPGGRVETNEPKFMALCREMREEHGVALRDEVLDVGRSVYRHEGPSGHIVRCYLIQHHLVIGTYRAASSAVAGFDWVTAEELERLTPLTPADEANREKLIALIR